MGCSSPEPRWVQVRFANTTMTLLTSTQFFSFLGAAMLVTVSPGTIFVGLGLKLIVSR